MLNYDIHTYWRNDEERKIALGLKQLLTQNQVQTFSLVDIPIGPHPLPMFEAHVSANACLRLKLYYLKIKAAVPSWFMKKLEIICMTTPKVLAG